MIGLKKREKKEPDALAAGGEIGDKTAVQGLKLPGKRKKRRLIRVLVIVALLAAAAVAVVPRLTGKKAGQVDSSYLVSTAVRRDLTESVTGTATLEPADSYNVTTLVSGEVLSAPFEEGDQVEKDDPLFSVDASDAANTASTAAVAVQQARNSYAQAKEAMYPTATLSGVISETYVKNGDTVSAGSQLCRIAASTDLTIDFLYSFDSANSIYVGQTAMIYLSGYAGTVNGTVASVSDGSTVADGGMRLRTVRVKVKNPGAVADGCTAQANIGGNLNYGSAAVSLASSGTVYASGSGTVTGFSKMAGSSVSAGQVLCTVESESNRTQLKNAKLAIDSSALTQSSAQQNMKDYRIKAPISGKVIEKNVKTGDMIKGMDSGTLAVVYDLSYLKLSMKVDELYIRRVQVGQKVEITADAVEGKTFYGVVDKVSINGTTTDGVTTYPVTITIREYGELLPGMNVSATIIGETVPNALCIPVDAVESGNTVLVPEKGAMNPKGTGVVDASKIKKVQVKVSRNDSEYIEVTDGLGEGDTVLTRNQASSAMDSMMGG
ncbi:MAG: efflux RND transporter periplasmic adaptor subunit [Oscillibacter sp.]|nr:efflux RND transporter periplasmic adaptor subunit [Oscillibacter sp.]